MILFFHTITNSKKLNTSKTQWYYVAIIRTIVYKHFPAKFLRRKRNEKLRQKKKKKKLQQTFFVSHQTSSCCTCNKRWPANCCPKTQGKQWHPGSSTSSNFPGAVLHCQFNNIWKKKSISLFFLSLLFFCWIFFDNLDLKKTIIKKCLKQIVG